MFDRVLIKVKAGSGGDGDVSFRHEKFVPFGGPDGGDGGDGGSVIIRADSSLDNLYRYNRKKMFKAEDGRNAAGRKKHGRNGRDLVLPVPLGTMVAYASEFESADIDLVSAGDEVVVVRGGRGGWGNTHYATSVDQTPRIAQRGEAGEAKTVLLEMRLIADVGIIGYPNAGKSTLLASVSAAKPKIADYPFTTLEPVLGTVKVGGDRFVIAEVPGLIEGAHLGKGLGHAFLQHIMRTRILLHLISGTVESPLEDMVRVNQELARYNPLLARKAQVVAVNKIDLPEVGDRLISVSNDFKGAGIRVHFVSAVLGQGVPELMKAVLQAVKAPIRAGTGQEKARKVFKPRPKDVGMAVEKQGEVFVLRVPELERLVAGPGAGPSELRWQMQRQLARRGLIKELERAGVETGSRVRCGEIEWEW
jgi:GTP-binding protein